ncbi:hypothetical protein [Ramlibacter rhizophilus]|uniref:hypothetical protein n=1 Tax=Ramlibacter rhizophilus TaxID=1781167 RepID=UPI00197F2DAC|nr:hypothetical protein [Ramlibacter rhizophilus]
MTTSKLLKGLLAGAAVAAMGTAFAQGTPPTTGAANPAMGAGQRNTQNAPMGTTGTPTPGATSSGSMGSATTAPSATTTPATPGTAATTGTTGTMGATGAAGADTTRPATTTLGDTERRSTMGAQGGMNQGAVGQDRMMRPDRN